MWARDIDKRAREEAFCDAWEKECERAEEEESRAEHERVKAKVGRLVEFLSVEVQRRESKGRGQKRKRGGEVQGEVELEVESPVGRRSGRVKRARAWFDERE